MALLFALPAVARAQKAPTPAELVGSWAAQGSKELGFTFRADSTLTYDDQLPQGRVALTGRWRLNGDTLIVTATSVTINGRRNNGKMAPRRLSLQDKQLTVTKLENGATPKVYERVDALVRPDSAAATPPSKP